MGKDEFNKIPNGTIIYIQGTSDYSSISKLIEGEELQRSIKMEQKFSAFPTDRPHTKISINHARFVTAVNNTTTLSQEDFANIYAGITDKFYPNKNAENELSFKAISLSPTLPDVRLVSPTDPTKLEEIVLTNELARGLNVTILCRVFTSKKFTNKGLSLIGVVVNEPIRYYENNGTNSALAALGYTITAAPVTGATPNPTEDLVDDWTEVPIEPNYPWNQQTEPQQPMQQPMQQPVAPPMQQPMQQPVAPPTQPGGWPAMQPQPVTPQPMQPQPMQPQPMQPQPMQPQPMQPQPMQPQPMQPQPMQPQPMQPQPMQPQPMQPDMYQPVPTQAPNPEQQPPQGYPQAPPENEFNSQAIEKQGITWPPMDGNPY